MRSVIVVSTFIMLGACASTAPDLPPVEVDTPPPLQNDNPTAFDLAMRTVEDLEMSGNEQAAILRLQQLIGNQVTTDAERAAALYRLAELQYGEGNDVFGAIATLDELLETYPNSVLAAQATDLRDTARGEATSLNFLLESDTSLSPTQRFEALFRLGRHQEALDLMLTRNLKPDNTYILDFYQIGFLCDDIELSGPTYDVIEPDGTQRVLRFCEFGK